MKKKSILLCLLISALYFSQRPSSTEKWSSILKRYEYFDSKGKITGYKKYNAYSDQWEIVDFQQNPESYRGGNSAYTDGSRIRRSVGDLEHPMLSSAELAYAKAVGQAMAIREREQQIYIIERRNSQVNDEFRNLPVDPAADKINDANKSALSFYNDKKFLEAANKFYEVYDLLKAAGNVKKKYLHYSALMYVNAGKKKEATDIYIDLLNSGYTGIETSYTAKNKKNNKVENLEKSTWDLYKKMGAAGDYTDFKTETSKSVEQELYETTAALLIDSERGEEALTLIEKGLKKYPASSKLAELQGSAYYKTGKTNEFVSNLKAQLAKNPNDANNWYNLGVLQSKDPATEAEGIASYKKAVEIKPDFAQAWQNLTYTTMGDDAKSIDDFNAARKAGKTELANKIIGDRRARLAATLPYAEKWYQYDANNSDVVGLLKGLYLSTKNDAKFKEFKAKEEAMKAGQK